MASMLCLCYMYKDELVAKYTLDSLKNKVYIEQVRNKFLDRNFGNNTVINMQEFDHFLESRCFPRQRQSCKEVLESLKLETYDPLAICLRTYGRQWDDYYWLKQEGEEISYASIKLRD